MAKARQARAAASLNAGRPARCLAPREPISVRHLRRQSTPRAHRPGRRVGTSLSSHFSSLLPGAHVGGAAWGCAWQRPRQRVLCVGWGGLALPALRLHGAARGSILCTTSAEIRGTQTYSVGGTQKEPAGHAPRATPGRHPVDPLPLLSLETEWGEEWKWGWHKKERAGGGRRRGCM